MNDSESHATVAQSATVPPMNFSTKLAFGAGDLGPAIASNILVFFLMVFFTNVAGLPAGLAGSILMIGKISDAINDPIVGVLSDRTRSRWGRRYPWMIFGAIPFGLLFVCQWLVPPLGQWGLFAYYVAIGILFNMAYTAVNLPYTALTPELTQDYNERTSLNSFRFAFSIGGSIGSLILAQLIFAKDEQSLSQNYLLFANMGDLQQRYLLLAGLCAIIAVLPIYWCFFGTRHRLAIMSEEHPEMEQAVSLPILDQLKIILGNRPFLLVIGIYLCSWLAVQITASILPYFVVNCMKLQQSEFPKVAVMVQGTALAMLFVWRLASDRYGKKAVYFMGVGLWIVAQAGLFFLQPDQVSLMYLLAAIAGFGVSTAYLIPWSMVPDTIDLDELKTGQRREGIFYAFMVLLQKMGLAVGLFLVGISLESAGFVEQVAGEPVPSQPDSALMAIRIAIGPLPTLVLVGGLLCAYFYPITREIHAGILLQLEERRSST